MTSPAIASLVVAGSAWGVLAAWPLMRRAARDPLRRRVVTLLRTPDLEELRVGAVTRRVRRGVWNVGFGAAVQWWQERRRVRTRRAAMERTLPLAVNVLTVAARAGYTPRLALRATAQWCPAELGRALRGVEDRCRLGAGLSQALDDLAAREPVLAPVAEALAAAERSGAPTADLLDRLAGESRAAFRRRAEAHARRVPVRLLFPLVFLVLPAFGLLTVVPALLLGLRDQ